jgi:hypothetical protein
MTAKLQPSIPLHNNDEPLDLFPEIWEKYNDYVNHEMMFDSSLEEIIDFPLWVEAHYDIPKEISEVWFYDNAAN